MKILFSIFLFFAFMCTVKSQVIEHYLSIEKSNDTLADFRYFKSLNTSICQKLDSLLVFIKASTKGYKKIKGFIEFSILRDNNGKIIADVAVNSQYADYRIFLSKNANFGNVFAFSFYKSNLILFCLSSSKYRIKDEYQPILHDLMYPEFSEMVKKEIDTKRDEFQINLPGILKRYYLKQ